MAVFILMVERNWAGDVDRRVSRLYGPYGSEDAAKEDIPRIKRDNIAMMGGSVTDGLIVFSGEYIAWSDI